MSLSKMLHIIVFLPDGRVMLRRNAGYTYGWPSSGRRNGLPWQGTLSRTSWAEDLLSILDEADREFHHYFRVPAREIGVLTFAEEVKSDNAQPLAVVTLHMRKDKFVHLTYKGNDTIETIGLEDLILETDTCPGRYTYQTGRAVKAIKESWKLGD